MGLKSNLGPILPCFRDTPKAVFPHRTPIQAKFSGCSPWMDDGVVGVCGERTPQDK